MMTSPNKKTVCNKTLRVVFVIYSTLCVLSLEAQTLKNRKLEKIVTRIEKQEYLFDSYELKEKSVRIANKLNKIATEAELVKLSESECKLCFCYSFWVLSKRQSPIVDKLNIKYYEISTEEISVQINNLKNNKSSVQVIMSDENFIYEIYIEKKYLDRIKTAYNNAL